MQVTSADEPLSAYLALLSFRASGIVLLFSCAGLLLLNIFAAENAPWSLFCISAVKCLASLALAVVVCSAACCLYGRWVVLLGVLAIASAAVVYFSEDRMTLLWIGLCGMWAVICLLIPAVGHAMRRKSLYTHEVDDTPVE